MKSYIVFLIAMCSVTCVNQSVRKKELQNSLVYIEAKSDKDGIMSGGFGDLNLINLGDINKQNLTDDDYYDEHPTFLRHDTCLIFATRRTGKSKYKDLSTPSRLFSLNLNTLKCLQIDLNYDNYLSRISDVVGFEYFCPSANNKSDAIAFLTLRDITKSGNRNRELIVHDMTKDSFYVIGNGVRGSFNLIWSDDDSLLAVTEFSSSSISEIRTGITIYNRYNKQQIKKISDKNWSYSVSAIMEDFVYYIARDLSNNKCTIFKMYLPNEDTTSLFSTSDYLFEEMVVVDSLNSYCLSVDEVGRNDVLHINFKTKTIGKITNNGLQKSGLLYLK